MKTYAIVFLISLSLPLVFLFIYFSLDTKIHTREQLKSIFNDIPILSEVPFLKDDIEKNNFLETSTRNNVIESFRMIATNLNYMNFNLKNDDTKIILVTSSIKGEGKTLISSNFANIISTRHDKTIILGCDLRNPQLHKYFNIDKNTAGLADFLYRNDIDYKDLILKHNNLDCIVSGTIPPNPIELLSSAKFKNLIDQLKLEYDYIIIDSAPCLLVSDTFEISKYATNTIYVVRSNFSDITLKDFIKENYENKKLNNMNLVFNSVGNSASYGYKYGYQYGYKYGYKYGYNYGYGYGYSRD